MMRWTVIWKTLDIQMHMFNADVLPKKTHSYCRQGSSIQISENACDASQNRVAMCDAENSISN